PQRGIYDDAKRYLDAQEANFSYIQDDTSGELRNALYDPQCFKGDRMQQLKTKLDALKQAVTSELDKTRKQANAMLDQMQQRMQTMDEYKALPEARTDELNAKFQELRSHFAQQRLIAVINALLRRFEEQGYQTLLRRMVEMAKPKPTHTDTSIGGKTSPGIKETKAEYVSARKLSIPFDKPLLRDSADVDRYVEALRQALLKEIGEGKQVQV
ncbi:MAG TPA: BREX system P-loop protein BrxC, partial [Chromatiaceae bacterium]|nr:BREX system P-loop protein BrxC [Chromatiaceae bacterium]